MTLDQLAERLAALRSETDPSLIVLDVGARWGVLDAWARFESGIQVLGVDPDVVECARLNSNAPEWVTYYPVALGARRGTAQLNITAEPACSSLYPPRTSLAERVPELAVIQPVGVQSVELTTLDDFLSSVGSASPHVLKLDTQGYELEILRGAERSLAGVDLVEIEVEFNPLYEGQPLFGDVDGFLRSAGFELWRLGPLVHYATAEIADGPGTTLATFFSDREASSTNAAGQLFWAQAYYVRTDLGLMGGSLTRQRAQRVGTGAFGLGLFDLAHQALERAEGQ